MRRATHYQAREIASPIVYALFVKTPQRMEVPGLILVLESVVWSLLERTMRVSFCESGSKITRWDKSLTFRPTPPMMKTESPPIIVLRLNGRGRPGNPPKSVLEVYRGILLLSEKSFFNSAARPSRQRVARRQ